MKTKELPADLRDTIVSSHKTGESCKKKSAAESSNENSVVFIFCLELPGHLSWRRREGP